jgi:hypothetical protein
MRFRVMLGCIILMISLAVAMIIAFCVNTERTPVATGTGWATLIGYSTSGKHKNSHAYLVLNKIGTRHDVYLGRRLDPAIELGDSIMVNYAVYGNEVELTTARVPTKPYSGRGSHYLK